MESTAHNCCVNCRLFESCTKPEYRCQAFERTCDGTRNCRPCPDYIEKEIQDNESPTVHRPQL